MDLWHKTLKSLDYNRYALLGAIMVAVVALSTLGCESTTRWLVDGQQREVSRVELEQQISATVNDISAQYAALDAKRDALIAAGEIATQDLDAKDEKRAAALSALGNILQSAATGGFDPVSVGMGLFGLATTFIGGGALMDNRRKNRVLEELKAERDAARNGQGA